ncbi:MAG TPA: hypothetical protein VK463_06705 [Desulfomonilaceae bacterium]|nr:hypothetical protein [Desulfomonilaceae bacterium]
MSDTPISRTTLTAELQIQFKYTIIHGTDPSRKSAEQKAFTKSLNLQGLIFESPRMEADGYHLSFTETTYGRNCLEMKLDLGKRFGTVEVIGQVEWYERRTTLHGISFIVGVNFVDIQADALSVLREFLQQSRGMPTPKRTY